MKSIQFLTSALAAGFAFGLASCSTEDPVLSQKIEGWSPEGKTTFALKTADTDTAKTAATTDGPRFVAMEREGLGATSTAKYKWEPGDKLWVELNRVGNLWVSDIENTIPQEGAELANFTYAGTFSNPQYRLLYTNSPRSGYESNKRQYTISNSQKCLGINVTKGLPLAGIATATKDATKPDAYNATKLEYHPAFLAILPRYSKKVFLDDPLLEGAVLEKINVVSGNGQAVAGHFQLNEANNQFQVINGDVMVSLDLKNSSLTEPFMLPGENNKNNPQALYMAIAPGETRVHVEYTLKLKDGTRFTTSRVVALDPQKFESNKIYDLYAGLKYYHQGMTVYYLWDAFIPVWNPQALDGPRTSYNLKMPNRFVGARVQNEDGVILPTSLIGGDHRMVNGLPNGSEDVYRVETTDRQYMQRGERSCYDTMWKEHYQWYMWAHRHGLPIYVGKRNYRHLGMNMSKGLWIPKPEAIMAHPDFYGDPDRRVLDYGPTEPIDMNIDDLRVGTPEDTTKYIFTPFFGLSQKDGFYGFNEEGFYWAGWHENNNPCYITVLKDDTGVYRWRLHERPADRTLPHDFGSKYSPVRPGGEAALPYFLIWNRWQYPEYSTLPYELSRFENGSGGFGGYLY